MTTSRLPLPWMSWQTPTHLQCWQLSTKIQFPPWCSSHFGLTSISVTGAIYCRERSKCSALCGLVACRLNIVLIYCFFFQYWKMLMYQYFWSHYFLHHYNYFYNKIWYDGFTHALRYIFPKWNPLERKGKKNISMTKFLEFLNTRNWFYLQKSKHTKTAAHPSKWFWLWTAGPGRT